MLVLFHSADTPGYPSAIFLIAKNTLLSRVCKSGMDVPQLHYRYPDTIWLHLVVQGTGIGGDRRLTGGIKSLKRYMRGRRHRTDIDNPSAALSAQDRQNRLIDINRSEKIDIKLPPGLFRLRKLNRTGNTKAGTIDHGIYCGLLRHLGCRRFHRFFIRNVHRHVLDTGLGNISAAELIHSISAVPQSRCRAPPDPGAAAGHNHRFVFHTFSLFLSQGQFPRSGESLRLF